MKDYSKWELFLDYENESINSSRIWLKNRPKNIFKSIKFDPIPVHELVKLTANKFPDNIAIFHKPSNQKISYRELEDNSNRIANALYKLEVKKGDCIGIMSGNCPDFLFCFLGSLKVGAILIPINPLLKKSDVLHIVREAGNVKVIFTTIGSYRIIKGVRKEIKVPEVIIINSKEGKPDTITLSEFINKVNSIQPSVEIDPDNDVATLLFTGGTTDLPKGVMLTHTNLVSAALITIAGVIESLEDLKNRQGNNVYLSILPLCHSMGFVLSIIILYAGWMFIMFSSFNPTEILQAIEYYKVTMFIGVPIMYQELANCSDFQNRNLSSLETMISGSAALLFKYAKKWEKVLGKKVSQGYGLTESSAVSHFSPFWLSKIKLESIGIPCINMDAKIVNPDTLEEVKQGEVGELLIKGPTIMKGYWKSPEATKRDIVDGWLRTGDLARMDKEGYFYIEGRSKDMIKYKSYKVMAKEVEEKLMEHPAILEVGVAGIPDPNIGETIKAWVVLKKDYRDKGITEREIIEWAKEQLAGYKYPRQVEFIKTLPRTAVGKIFRRKLREMELEKKQKPLAPL